MTDKHDLVPRADTLPAKKAAGVLHPAVEMVLRQNPTPETVREMMALQREHEAAEAKKAYAQDMVALKRELPGVINRDTTVDYSTQKGRVHYTHASLAGAMEAVLPALTRHGFSASWKPSSSKDGVKVTCTITHHQGHSDECTLEAPADTSGSKSPAQAIASTITLLERYSLLAVLGIATADMREPQGPASAAEAGESAVDSARNMRALREIVRRGKTKEEAEKVAGGPIQGWTAADLDKLRAWLKPEEPKPEPAKDETPRIPASAVAKLKKYGKEFKLSEEELRTVAEIELGRDIPALSVLTAADFAVLDDAFRKARAGEVDFKRYGLCFVRPDDAAPDKTDVELDAEAAQEEIPF